MKLPLLYLPSLALLLMDQWLKQWMTGRLPLCRPWQCESLELLPFLQLTLLHNQGAAFGFLHDAGGWQRWFLVAVAGVLSLVLAVWLHRARSQPLLAAALALILGGALGNLLDRARDGYVVDFIVLHHGGWHFPAFNLADAAISVGAALLVLEWLLAPRGLPPARRPR